MNDELLLKIENISKSFPGVVALNEVDFDLCKGEVHAILGENGAGKSTLIKLLTGVYSKDRGKIYIEGKEVIKMTPNISKSLGINVVYQEFPHCPRLNVAQNIFLGKEPSKWGVCIDWTKMYRNCREVLRILDMKVDPHSYVNSLRLAEKQSIEIIRALSNKCKILILDEPTSALSEREIQILFDRVNKLKDSGMSIIFISHKINEVKILADRVTVLRDGKKIGTVSKREIIKKDLIKMMIGRELRRQFPKKNKVNLDADPVLVVSNLTRKNVIKNISFRLRKGEILGISGLVGSARTELVRCIFGIDKIDSGTIEINGKIIKVNSTNDALRYGIGLVPEERRGQGLIINRSVQENITYPIVDSRLCNFGFILKWGLLKNIAKNFEEKLDIKCVDLQQKVSSLSGGNQQKVVVSKWLAARSKILILDEPTIGIDVGAKAEIYRILNELAKQEVGIIIVSSELEEIIGLCNRAIIMKGGMVAGELKEDELNSKNIGKLSFR